MKKELTVKEMARKGGNSTLKKYGKKHFSKIGKLGRSKKPKNGKAN